MKSATKPINRWQKRKQETRRRIEEAAYALFKQHGIDATSVEMICEQADVARRTFYTHYPNKHALLGGLGISRIYGQAAPMLASLMAAHESTRDRLTAMIDFIENKFSTYETIDRQLIVAAPATFANDLEQQRAISSSALSSFEALIAAGQRRGDARSEFSPEILASTVIGTLNTLTINWAIDTDYPILDRLEEARAVFESLICTPA